MKRKGLIVNGKTESVLYMDKGLGEFFGILSSVPRSSVVVVADRNAVAPTERIFPGFFQKITDPHRITGPHQDGLLPIILDATESRKTLGTIEELCRKFEQAGADRDSLIIAVGGGITTDIVGFAASVYRRGLRAVFIPTTLLAQVDAAIGGKNGVNLDGYKNMIGTIRQPLFVFSATGYLLSMPPQLIVSGLPELLKAFIIGSKEDYETACRIFSGFRADSGPEKHSGLEKHPDLETLSDLIFSAASIKTDIVSEDSFEHGRRELLNLGHTFAHAIETVTEGATAHGLAVAEGIVMAARAGEMLGITEAGFADKIEKDFAACRIRENGKIYGESPADLLPVMLDDKKMHADGLHLIVPVRLGKVVSVPVTESRLKKILSGL